MFTFVESAAFDRHREVYLDDDEYLELQQYMMQTRKLASWCRDRGARANGAAA